RMSAAEPSTGASSAALGAAQRPAGPTRPRGLGGQRGTALLEPIEVARYFDVSLPWLNRMIERKPRQILKAVDGVSLTIAEGETLGLVGESGCGKSTVARLIVGLYQPTRGEIRFAGRRIDFSDAERALRRTMQMIFQDPYASLNPRLRRGEHTTTTIRGRGGPTSSRSRYARTASRKRRARSTRE